MIVQHNMQAANSNRMLGTSESAAAKSTEKLSSGYRINRAADDAAGLSISEKMRKQIRGLEQASTNAQDGISAVQTAEGALTEVHSMLQRMNELATQSANGTNSQSDRDAIQAEIDQLATEIDRVSETTKFNETYLLKGDETATKTVSFYESQYYAADYSGLYAEGSDTAFNDADELRKALSEGKKIYTVDAATGQDSTYEAVKGTDYYYLTTFYAQDANTGEFYTVSADEAAEKINNSEILYCAKDANAAFTGSDLTGFVRSETINDDLSFILHVGADSEATNKIGITIEQISAKGLGVSGLDVSSEDEATVALDTIAAAIQKVSDQRSKLGAVQNRLEHTISNLDNVVENTTSAESRIRDVDMAEEMVEYSKYNILQQAGQSMLAQANQATQGVLSLF